MDELVSSVHKRRKRYSGTHPRHFDQKYKELDPERYSEDVAKIIANGKTPAGMHIPIMVNEILEFLDIKPGQIGYDATLGYGGHSLKMLQKLDGKGHLYATDVDIEESSKTLQRIRNAGYSSDVFTLEQMNFSQIDKVAPDVKFDFVLADLGVSSMQIDNPERGFTFKEDGPLDLRLDRTRGVTAAQRLRELSFEEISGMLKENSDEPYAKEIADKVFFRMKQGAKMDTTTELREAIEAALAYVPKDEKKEAIKKSCQRTFQALRIDVNSEFEVLYSFLDKLPGIIQ